MEIVFIPLGGLCNRIRGIASAMHIAKELDASLSIRWNHERGCNANFCDLFEAVVIPNVSVVENRNPLYTAPRQRNLRIPAIFQKFLFKQRIYDYSKIKNVDILDQINPDENLLMSSPYTMCKHFDIKKIFVPKGDILEMIPEFDGNYTTGIHIRGTDYREITDEFMIAYETEMDAIIENEPRSKFFLATDEVGVKDRLMSKYGNRILSLNINLSRTNVDGMRGAVADLWALSRTNKVLGTYYSSFSKIAAEIGGVDLIVPVKDFADKMSYKRLFYKFCKRL